jgi:RimJ/RimL family protein N-acetyltransferase/predicted ATP-grasp superfamily ATP-dependent carboligase
MNYKCLKYNHYTAGDYSLVPLREEDIYLIKKWRNEQIDVLRQKKPLTDKDQKLYYENFIYPTFLENEPKQILFSFLKEKSCIGYGGLTNIDWQSKRVELSFLVDTSRIKNELIYGEDFTAYLNLIKQVVFDDLDFNRIFSETYDIRPFHISVHEKNGFRFEGRMKEHNLIGNAYYDSLLHGFLKSDYEKSRSYKEHASENQHESAKISFNVLVTSISKKIPMLKAVKEACSKLSHGIGVIGADSDSECIGKWFVDKFWQMPAINNLGKNEIISYCKEHNIKVILPSRDGELLFWSELSDDLKQNGIAVMICDPDAVAKSLDKTLFYKFLEEIQLPGIPTVNDINQLNCERYVVKEKFGAGSESIGLDLSKGKAIELASKMNDPVFQPFIKGKEFSIDIYNTCDYKFKAAVVRSRDLIISGESQITRAVKDDYLENLAREFSEKLPLVGHGVLQVLVDKNKKYHIIEFNCRFGGASTLSVSCGLDSFYWFLLESLGNDPEGIPVNLNIENKIQIRYPEDLIIYDPGF